MNLIKISLINFLVLLLFLSLGEVIFRSAHTVASCLTTKCDFSFISKIKLHDARRDFASLSVGISRFDEYLGYVPHEEFDATITQKSWQNAKVTISSEGFRLNDNAMMPSRSDVLVVGDSFTFGDQVSNHETWPACL